MKTKSFDNRQNEVKGNIFVNIYLYILEYTRIPVLLYIGNEN